MTDLPTRPELDAIRNRVADETATQQDCFRLLRLVDTLKYNLFLRDVQDDLKGKSDTSLMPVRRFLILSDWMTTYQRARRLWLKRCAIWDEQQSLYEGTRWFQHEQDRYRALSIQRTAVDVRLARLCERMSDADVARLLDTRDCVCAAEAPQADAVATVTPSTERPGAGDAAAAGGLFGDDEGD